MLELPKGLPGSGERSDKRAAADVRGSDMATAQSSLVLYQTSDCFSLIKEAMLCEGMAPPEGQLCQVEQIAGLIAKAKEPLVFIEVEDCPVEVAHALKQSVSHNSRVVLVGREDRISTYRTLEELGFYYLLWPARKDEVVSFLQALMDDVLRSKGPHLSRTAMRIAVVSMKGGSGCTMIAAEMAYALGRKTRQPVMIADHGYCHSNMAIMLGKKDLARRPISEEGFKHNTLTNILDPVGVQSQLVRVEGGISYLGFESREVDAAQMQEYTRNMITTQLRETNFIIEDYSASVNFHPDPRWLCPSVDCVLLVVPPSLSGLHETRDFLRELRAEMAVCDDPARLLVVLNQSLPPGDIEKDMVEQFLDYPVSIELPYQKNCEAWLTSGKRFIDGKNKLAIPFQQLIRIVLGKPVSHQQSLTDRVKGLVQALRVTAGKRQFVRKSPELNEPADNLAEGVSEAAPDVAPAPGSSLVSSEPNRTRQTLKTDREGLQSDESDENKTSTPIY